MSSTPSRDTKMIQRQLPVLYSFRRCPFAMRARMAISSSAQSCELREVVLRDKPAEMTTASPKATVPVWIDLDGTVRDESLQIMLWALSENDPDGWLTPQHGTQAEMMQLIERIDGPFKHHLDRYKYAPRYAAENEGTGIDPHVHRDAAMELLQEHETRLANHRYLFGDRPALADIATAPFIRQYANTDRSWFDAQAGPKLHAWLVAFLGSDLFQSVMEKHKPWQPGTEGVLFPPARAA